jgi:hypothetical protein
MNSSWRSAAVVAGSVQVAITKKWFSLATISKKLSSLLSPNRMRRDRKKQEDSERGRDDGEFAQDGGIIDFRNYKPKRIPQLMWRECIKKVWEVDPLTCPKCTGEMRIISFIY